jgi:hypothetical protein
MERLRGTIAQYGHWQELSIYMDRIEGHLETDFSISIENAKALLESIGKEICCAKGMMLGSSPSINAVLKKAFLALGYSNEDLVNKVSGSLATIGQELGKLRNDISPTSHGKSLDELRDRNNKIDLLTREFLIDSTLVVAVFLIRTFEERKTWIGKESDKSHDEQILDYERAEDFNNFWDESFGEFAMGEYSYTASEILYNVDLHAYQTEYKSFKESEIELVEDN